MIGLTEQQRRLLEFIDTYMARSGGVSPSYIEMRDALGLASKSGVHRLVFALEERGMIRRLPNRVRAIEILTPLAVDLTNVPLAALVAEVERRGHHPLRPDGAALPSGHILPEPSTAPPAIDGSGPSNFTPFHAPEVTDV